MRKNSERKIVGIGFLLSLILGFVLRVYNLTAISLWHDEAFSTLMVKYPFQEMISRLILDVHPPLYYIAFYGWNYLLGNSLLSLRLFSVLFGLLVLIGLYLFLNEAFANKKLSFWIALIAAVNPFLIQYAQEGRMYSFGLALVVFAGYFLLKAAKKKNDYFSWFMFIFLSSAAIYTHYYLFFSVAGLFVFLVYKAVAEKENRGYFIKSTLLSAAFMLILYLPWLKAFISQFSQVQANYWIPEMSAWSLPNTLINLLTGGVVPIGESNWYLGVIIVGLILFFLWQGTSYLRNKSRSATVLFLALFLTPFILAVLFSLKQSVYLDRYFIFVVPFYLTVLTAGIFSIKNRKLSHILLLILLVLMLLSYTKYWRNMDINNRPGMAAAEDYLTINYEQDDKILINSSFIYFTFRHYNQTGQQAYLYAPGELTHFSGTALLKPADIVKTFQEFGHPGDRVWLLSTNGFGSQKPDPPDDWYKLSEEKFADNNSIKGEIFVQKYRVFGEESKGMIKYINNKEGL